ncbi:ABC transporter substrate-binding protein [Lentilactobacillus otakiensis]|uniref:Family 1 extracellular solute-binding protein n=1 Tax=Lentilactobacillus otakiensis DSM 19908 = JCM 15040 TaxID=1423780 RepID=S4ND43_9LACO|nr:ABC transporter substrate-binding protein [Lentilactobacillus otakiensis]KRL11618.1 family 1 extracellular solute-binding protein [Lentilactobacillus otakiensis DSM 19908 = JCM 15040]MBZ3776760.1 ABC transporter substrate-binding protein [Lentilactobacillus otakiensis]MDV3519292.1 ABC transporter substrate-binding protein [Lentilactobacillus otakiensis]GAD16779.1 family 1 extracellular solute-binding protein [Lentilactobacillus otakiensis DSM 19908 = JCM 15040]
MKKFLAAFIAILALCGGLAYGSNQLTKSTGDTGNKVLNLYNWGDYIDPALLTKFQKETGYHVNVETFDSNEAMYTKIKQGGTSYDLTVPSEYMVEKMKTDHMLIPLDKSRLTGMNNYGSSFMNKSFDRGNKYSIPYFWGTLGIIYNDQSIKPGSLEHWNQLWSTKYRNDIMLIDSARDIMGFSLISMGKSVNTTNSAELIKAKDKLNQLSPNVKAVVADEIKMYMAEGEAPVAVDWSGEASEMMSQNSHLHYVVPTEGSNMWFDNLVIPKTAKHFKAIYAFLNFMSKPENAAQNAEYIGYSTPNTTAYKLLPKNIRDDKQFYPDQKVIDRLQVYSNLSPQKVQEYNDLYLEFKMHH